MHLFSQALAHLLARSRFVMFLGTSTSSFCASSHRLDVMLLVMPAACMVGLRSSSAPGHHQNDASPRAPAENHSAVQGAA